MRRLKNILFHRATLLLVALLLQALFLFAFISIFQNYWNYFYTLSVLLSLAVLIWILNDQSNPAYKIAWIVPILLFPVFGGVFYLVFGRSTLDRKTRKELTRVHQRLIDEASFNGDILAELNNYDQEAGKQAHYLFHWDQSPIFKNTQTTYFPLGEDMFAAMKTQLEKAEKYIFLQYFIIQPGIFWDGLLEILTRKAAIGVDVRVIYDDVGCLMTMPSGYPKKLEKLGIKCCIFNPVRFMFSPKPHHRDHRKILVIDGKVAFTGGINLADEYINAFEKHGHWKDTAVMMEGEAAWGFTLIFLSIWDYIKGTEKSYRLYEPESFPPTPKAGAKDFVQPFAYDPVIEEPIGQNVYLNLINSAKETLYIMTPYLILDNEMTTALALAAKSGVDVRILTPHVPDKWLVHAITRSYYPSLLKSGVRIFEYTPGFIHAKSVVVDNKCGVIGTINFDYRSLFLHFECAVWLYGTAAVQAMHADFLTTEAMCEEITLEIAQKWPKTQKAASVALRLFAPLF